MADEQASFAIEHTGKLLPIAVLNRPFKIEIKPNEFQCPRAHECKWQLEAGEELCPPRRALAAGLDTQVC